MRSTILPFLLILALFAAFSSEVMAGPRSTADVLDIGHLLDPAEHVSPTVGFLATLQDEWGWGEDEEGGEEGGEEDSGDEEDDEWGTGSEEDGGWSDESPTPGLDERKERTESSKILWVGKMRFGIEIGGLLPTGEKEQAFSAGEMAGIFLGYKLLDISKTALTGEFRLLQAYTTSSQDTGHDVTTLLFLLKHDFQIHLFPRTKGFNIYLFLGVALAMEMSSAERTNPWTSATESDSGTFFGFIVDAGLGAWVHLGGPVDLLLRLEANMVPVTGNVPFFVVGQLGLQFKF